MNMDMDLWDPQRLAFEVWQNIIFLVCSGVVINKLMYDIYFMAERDAEPYIYIYILLHINTYYNIWISRTTSFYIGLLMVS